MITTLTLCGAYLNNVITEGDHCPDSSIKYQVKKAVSPLKTEHKNQHQDFIDFQKRNSTVCACQQFLSSQDTNV